MHQQTNGGTAPAAWVDQELAYPFLTESQRSATDYLNAAFKKGQPLAVLTGEGNASASLVISDFLAGIEDEVSVARIAEPPGEAIEFMRHIIRAIDLGSKNLSAGDLEKVFAMFLAYQRTHNRRTIICIEQAQECGPWVLDKIRRLVERENKKQYGLTIILSGQPNLGVLLSEPPLNLVCGQGGAGVSIAPFTLSETTEYIQRRVEAQGVTDIGQVFEYEAITLVHELSEGVLDYISDLCNKCLALAAEEDEPVVTPDLVMNAGNGLRTTEIEAPVEIDNEPEETELELDLDDSDNTAPRIMLTHEGITLREMVLDQPRLMIGRSNDCDLRVISETTSRHHAVIVQHGDATIVMDLNSTNGTFVNSRRVASQVLIDQDIISIGDHRIKYINPNAKVRTTLDETGINDTVAKKSLDDVRRKRTRERIRVIPGKAG